MLRSPLHMEKIEYHDDSSGSDGSSSSQGGRQHRRTTSGGVWREVPYVKNDATTYEGTMNREEKSYTWTQLNAIENRRRAILRRGGLPFWQVLTYYDGTVLTVLSRAYVMWITMGIYCFIRLQARFDSSLSKFVQDLGDSDIGIIGGFLSFFLVLFVNQSNSRFNEMYQTSMSVSSRVLDISSLVATSFPKPNAQRIIRYLNAAHAAGYVGISKIYSRRHFFDHLNSDYCFLHTVELKRLGEIDMDCGADASHEIIQWCMADVQRAFKDDHVSAREAGVLKDKLLQFRGSMDTLYDYCDQPIHFFYVHFLCLLSILYLPLFAVDNAYSAGTGDQVHWTSDVLHGLIVMLQAIFVIGLRMLGQKLIDPFGDDLEDLSVLHYIKSTWATSNRILSAQFTDALDPIMEESLDQKKESIGRAWEPKVETGLQAA